MNIGGMQLCLNRALHLGMLDAVFSTMYTGAIIFELSWLSAQFTSYLEERDMEISDKQG
jgi:hypothetical protein